MKHARGSRPFAFVFLLVVVGTWGCGGSSGPGGTGTGGGAGTASGGRGGVGGATAGHGGGGGTTTGQGGGEGGATGAAGQGGRGGTGGGGGAAGRGGTGGAPCGSMGQACCAGGVCNVGICVDLGGGPVCAVPIGGHGGTGGATGGTGGASGGRGGTGGAAGQGGHGGAPCGSAGQTCCAGDGGMFCNAGTTCIALPNGTSICGLSGVGGRGGAGGSGANTFSCGSSTACEVNAQYCLQVLAAVPEIPPSYACLYVPSACMPTPTCSCLQAEGIGAAARCAEGSAGALRVTLAAP
jgi:hypothetical protein